MDDHGRDEEHAHDHGDDDAKSVPDEQPRVEESLLEDQAADADEGMERVSEQYDRPGEREDHEDHDAHADHGGMHAGHEEMFRRRFFVSLVLSIPVLLYSEMLQELLGFSVPAFPGSEWVSPLFAVVVFAYGGVPFLRMAVPEVRAREPGMMTLISMAISVAFVYSLASVVSPGMTEFFWELVTLIDVMLLGHWIEMRSVRRASGALDELAKLLPDTAERVIDEGAAGRSPASNRTQSGDTEEVPVSDLAEGDLVLVRPGASVPADGVVESGESDVNEAMITGESMPVEKEPGAEVIGGTINGDGSLRVRVTATGERTALAGIMRLVEEAQASESETQVLADRAAGWLFYVAVASAAVTAVAWTVAVTFDAMVVERAVTVLVIACPHALGLAVPLVVAINTSLAARNGMLVRDRIAMELARDLDVVVFDKTGTLTKGEQGVVDVATAGIDADEAFALAAAVERDSEHMIARAIRDAASDRGVAVPDSREFEAIKGRGARAVVEWPSPGGDGHSTGGGAESHDEVFVGGPNLLEHLGVEPPPELAAFAEESGEQARTVVYLLREREGERSEPSERASGSDRRERHASRDVLAAFALADVIRPESRQAIDALHELGVEVAMLTGDSAAVARAVADELGIDTVFAEVLPDEKDEKIAELQEGGTLVGMVGDGVNDAPALVRADVGIAIGSGTDVAVQSADVVLVGNDPTDVVRLIRLSRASYRKMQENLVWAAGYNVFAIPLAAGVLAPIGILLSPAVGALLMSLSTVIVAINAQLLRRVDLDLSSLPGVSSVGDPRPTA